MLEHADHIERHFEHHGPDEATVRLSQTDDVFLRSCNWARVQLGSPLPAVEKSRRRVLRLHQTGRQNTIAVYLGVALHLSDDVFLRSCN